MTYPTNSQDAILIAETGQHTPKTTQLAAFLSYHSPPAVYANVSQAAAFAAYAPPASTFGNSSQAADIIAYKAGPTNLEARCSQYEILVAYREGIPGSSRQGAWTFILDGHRFYVLPLSEEGDWAYDTTTREWCQLQTQGFDGLNFTHGVMWDLRIIGGDALYGTLYEMDPNQPEDEEWRSIEHIVTGAISSRNINMTSVGNFRLTASVGDLQASDSVINLRFSDDNGNTWSNYQPITLQAGNYSRLLVWSALGSFQSPGRIFEISDEAGLVSIYGADASLVGTDDNDDQSE